MVIIKHASLEVAVCFQNLCGILWNLPVSVLNLVSAIVTTQARRTAEYTRRKTNQFRGGLLVCYSPIRLFPLIRPNVLHKARSSVDKA